MFKNNAYVVDGIVQEIITPLDGYSLEQRFASDFIECLVACPDDVQPGWVYDGQNFKEPEQPIPTKADLTAYCADKRWRVETGGIIFNDLPVATDRESQSMIARTFQTMELTGQSVKFKTDAGFFEMDLDTMKALSLFLAAHVQACFNTEAEVSEKITGGEITSFEQIDNYEWPPNT